MSDPFTPPGPKDFIGEGLDNYLERGFFRFKNILFTAFQIFLDNEQDPNERGCFTAVFWLRTLLNGSLNSRSANKIRRKCAQFKVSYQPAQITPEIEDLYSLYREHINFDHYPTCRDCMLENDQSINPFNSWMTTVHDGDKLIAIGYFDLGHTSSMAILNFYHPAFSKFSLGKFLMLKTMDYCKELGKLYYYPGYITIESDKMDYKIFPNPEAIEVFFAKANEWKCIANYSKSDLDRYFKDFVEDFIF